MFQLNASVFISMNFLLACVINVTLVAPKQG